MSQELDISWQVLRRIAQEWGGASAELAQATPLDGGCISSTVELGLEDGRRAVCKISSHRVDHSYVNEAHQLRAMRELGVPTPEVYAAKVGSLDDPFSYILMEFVEGVNLHEAKRKCTEQEYDGLQTHLAELILRMHEKRGESYGWMDAAGKGMGFGGWPAFFRKVFDPICEEALQMPGIGLMCKKKIGKLQEHLDQWLANEDGPRMVHWDVWSSNVLAGKGGDGEWRVTALLDPNCKYAHAEAEIAYMALFHTSTPAFMKAYQQGRRLGDEYHRLRKPIYQVYFLLNHVHLFGAEYVKRLVSEVEKLGFV